MIIYNMGRDIWGGGGGDLMASRNSYGYTCSHPEGASVWKYSASIRKYLASIWEYSAAWPKLQVHNSAALIWKKSYQIAKTHTVVVTIPVHILYLNSACK